MQAMAKLPPTVPQLEYLKALAYNGPVPATSAEASVWIDEMIQQGQQ